MDSLADALEEMGADLDALSTRIFDFDVRAGGVRRRFRQDPASTRPGAAPHPPQRRAGGARRSARSARACSASSASSRSSPASGEHLLGATEMPRFETLRRDIASLDEFEIRLSENVQFLLDATLGLINIEQNNTFRVLTVVSVVGVCRRP